MLPHKDTPLTVTGKRFPIFIETVNVKHNEKSKEFILFERTRKNHPETTNKTIYQEIIQNIVSYHSGRKLEINYRKKK